MKPFKQVTLLVTRACNLRCSYCYVRDYTGGEMTLETARDIVRRVFSADLSGYDGVEFTFMGGEPFCNFPLIRALSHWMWEQEWPKEYILSAVTNGTLIRGEVRRWLEENRHRFFLSLSYDGSEDSQNENRSDSAEGIDLDFFHRNWPDQPLKMTVSEETAPRLAGDIMALRRQGIPANDTFAGGGEVWSEVSLAALSEQLGILADFELTRPEEERHSDLLSIDLRPVLRNAGGRPFSCGAGTHRITYDYDGREYACHLLSPLVLTEEEMSRLPHAQVRPLPPKCAACPLRTLCPTCEGGSFRQKGCFGCHEDSVCALFPYQVYHACRYQAKRILRRPALSPEDGETLAAIRALMAAPGWIPAAIRRRAGGIP